MKGTSALCGGTCNVRKEGMEVHIVLHAVPVQCFCTLAKGPAHRPPLPLITPI